MNQESRIEIPCDTTTAVTSSMDRVVETYDGALGLSADDRMVPRILLSTCVANLHPRLPEPVWLMIIGPPGGSKTEVLRPLKDYRLCEFISSLTENALLSGFSSEDGEDPSFILRLDGKLLVCKDMTTLIHENPVKMSKILGDFRDAFDGFCAKPSGRAGLRSYHATFGFLSAVTPSIDAFNEENQQLGERFLSVRMSRYPQSCESELSFLTGVMNKSHDKAQWRASLAEVFTNALEEVLDGVTDTSPLPEVPADKARQVTVLAYLLSKFRATPIRGNPVDAEIGTRLLQQLTNLGHAHCLAGQRDCWNDDDLELLRRVVLDTLTTHRRRLLMALYIHQIKHAGDNGDGQYPGLTVPRMEALSRVSAAEITSIMNQYCYTSLMTKEELSGALTRYRIADDIFSLVLESGLFSPGSHLPNPFIERK